MKRFLSLLMCFAVSFSLASTTVSASESASSFQKSSSSQVITPYADVIVKIYRRYDNKLQYRRWNETRGYWVDSDWTDV
mgnify:CR=1 FL=1